MSARPTRAVGADASRRTNTAIVPADPDDSARHHWTDAVWASDALRPLEKLVALVYAKHAGAGIERVWVTFDTLVAHTNQSRSAASRALHGLRDKGWLIEVEKARQHRAARYRLNVPSRTEDGRLSRTGDERLSESSRPSEDIQPSISGSPAVREMDENPTNPKEPPPGGEHDDRTTEHANHGQAVRALARIHQERQLPVSLDELTAHAYRLGDGDPWLGYQAIRDCSERDFRAGANDPRDVFLHRLRTEPPRTHVRESQGWDCRERGHRLVGDGTCNHCDELRPQLQEVPA